MFKIAVDYARPGFFSGFSEWCNYLREKCMHLNKPDCVNTYYEIYHINANKKSQMNYSPSKDIKTLFRGYHTKCSLGQMSTNTYVAFPYTSLILVCLIGLLFGICMGLIVWYGSRMLVKKYRTNKIRKKRWAEEVENYHEVVSEMKEIMIKRL
ncbi:hypothetical protein VCUG_01578 [Vavraia culicis subsp. floridensis]|uniref:PIR Superfamily Protein n=1 Tax=Vavraia culicis (isolate floridensis) TaxID=948595 RepID=L2GTL8_VAVCU|nr:uncharacterized protein VCUG_01578 [Vavraia culicis subsp. floridensis]ELA46959.1 hypothetical protein VCUG_01578 [Vavraia culicis subsp. floridensis]